MNEKVETPDLKLNQQQTIVLTSWRMPNSLFLKRSIDELDHVDAVLVQNIIKEVIDLYDDAKLEEFKVLDHYAGILSQMRTLRNNLFLLNIPNMEAIDEKEGGDQ